MYFSGSYSKVDLCLACQCRIGRSSFTSEECAANALHVLKQAVKHLPRKWEGVRAVFVKTPSSLALPVFQTLPEAITEPLVVAEKVEKSVKKKRKAKQ